MSNHTGVQLVAPDGFEQMEKGRVYHLLRSDGKRERVLLVYFIQRPMVGTKKAKRVKRWTPLPMPIVIGIRRAMFEQALVSGWIRKATVQTTLPPWLAPLEGRNLASPGTLPAQVKRVQPKRSHQDRIDTILHHLQPLLPRLDEILGAESPDKAINAHARACNPPQNESRMRVWFFTYVAFGFTRSALHYPVHKLGRWDRLSKETQKLGRSSLRKGAQQGFRSDPGMIGKILQGYRRFAGLGVRMSSIYRDTMLKIFRCNSFTGENGYMYYVHPDGVPFPTCNQFTYRVIEHFGAEDVWKRMYGEARYRNRLAPSMGTFTEAVGNLMERVEADAYWVEEVARGYIDQTYLPGLCVVRLRCVTSGLIVGIGFSLGGELGEAYRAALFCAAIDKVLYCRLLGVEIRPEEWPSIGLPPCFITDRGPGGTSKGRARDLAFQPPVIELAPSWMGQSKAIVESSHPRSIRVEGQPTFKPTSMTVTQLVVREVMRAVGDNKSKDVSSRLNNQAVIDRVQTTPIALWNYLDDRGRNDAISVPFDTAVRQFLPQVSLQLRADGVYLEEQRYDADDLRSSGLLDKVATSQTVEVLGFVYPMAVRQVWVDGSDALIEVSAILNIRDGEDQLYISIAELTQIAQLRREEGSLVRVHRHAVKADMARRCEEVTGHPFDSRTRKVGRAKRGGQLARQEAAEAKKYLRPKGGRT